MTEKPTKKISEGYLERAALHYLGRFSATEAHLRLVLERKVRRRNEGNAAANSEQLGWIANVSAKCVRLGYVDDAHYAKNRFESLLRKGKPLRTIRQDLRHKGVADEVIKSIMADAQIDTSIHLDLSAAAAYVRRRRFGPFRRHGKGTDEKIEKEKAAMLRAGFSFQITQEILSSTEGEILALLP